MDEHGDRTRQTGAEPQGPETGYRHVYVEPSRVYDPPPPRPSRDFSLFKDLGLVLFVAVAIGVGLVTWNMAGEVTAAIHFDAPPSASAVAIAVATATPVLTAAPSATPAPTPTEDPGPVRKAVDMTIERKPKSVFASEAKNTWCAAAAVQIALNVNGPKIDRSQAYQAKIRRLEVAATDRKDSRNGGAGPLGMVATLNDLGPVTYELRIYKSRDAAVRDAARAVSATGHAVILLAWRGAHSWVMTGFRADADPVEFGDARIKGAYILDPWYPRVSRIWGPSDPPGAYQDAAEMRRNYLPWRRPEGRYPGRDGKFLAIVPADAP